MSEWQPIETAPKDGTHILAWESGVGFGVVRWASLTNPVGHWRGDWEINGAMGDDWDTLLSNPSAWMPLPKPPQ